MGTEESQEEEKIKKCRRKEGDQRQFIEQVVKQKIG
jgi:hypothetical protein